MADLNLIDAVRFYIDRIIDSIGSCMKVLIMDKETISIISMVFAQSEILQKEVFLFEMIDAVEGKPLKHLSAVCLLRVTDENIQTLIRELQKPKYGTYDICFTNTIEQETVQQLAMADEFECVRSIQEFHLDYYAMSPHLFSLNIPIYHHDHLQRTAQGLISVLLSLRRQKLTIHYQASSKQAQTLAGQCHAMWRRTSFSQTSNSDEQTQTILLIVDRRSDPVTPLLNQWTYQAMIHELIGIKNNRVNLSQVPDIAKELEEVILNARHDEFYANNQYANFGEIANNIKLLMEDYQEKHKNQSRIESINDMKSFVETYPQFKKLSGTVSKHVTIISELSRLVSLYQLLEVSETEQNLVCQNDHNEIVRKIRTLINNTKVRNEDIIRILCLYALRYHETKHKSDFNSLKNEASKIRRFSEQLIRFIEVILDFSHIEKDPSIDLFHEQSPMAITRQLFRNLKGVDNVYAQHVPLIKTLIEQLLRGKLKETHYPSLGENRSHSHTSVRPSELVVFVVGGITYEESYHIQMMNKQGARIVLGGSYIHNFSSFMDMIVPRFE